MKNRRGMIRTIALLLCLVMIGTLLPAMASADLLAAPKLTGAKANGKGILVTWKTVTGITTYRVFRKTGGGGWSILGDTTKTSWQDNSAAQKTTYTYTVRGVSGGNYISKYDTVGVSATWSNDTAGIIATPTMISATSASNGVVVKWGKVATSPGYRIFRKVGSGGWKALKDVGDVDNYLDKDVQTGKTYTYTVRCLKNGNLISDFDHTGKSCTYKPGYIATPKLVSAVAEGSGLRVTWQAVSGAYAYRVYRKIEGGSWSELVTVKGTSYLDNATNKGTTYIYTVRCVNANNELISSYDANGVKGDWNSGTIAYSTPKLKAIAANASGMCIAWEAVTGAPQYRIFRKTASTNWVGIGVTTATSYTDTNVTSGVTYTYTVRVRDAAGNLVSGYDSKGLTKLYVAPPKLVSLNCQSDGIQVNWNASAGAPLYMVFRKTGGGSWQQMGTTTGTSFKDKKVVIGTAYTYTVRAVHTNKTTFLSGYDPTGLTTTFTGKSAVTGLSNQLGGVKIDWTAVDGATQYQVMRKTGEGGWIELTKTTALTYLDATAVNNTTHYYQVRALDAANNVIGSYDNNGASITYYVAPTLVNCVRSSGGLLTSWEAVEGISNYLVYRKYGVGSWELVGSSTSTSYLDKTPPSGTFCYYTVRCANASGSPVSSYQTPGVGETSYMDQPILNAAVNNNGTITVTWNSVDKATNYRVFRRTGDKTSWRPAVVNNTTALSWVDTDVLKGQTYYYSVCVIKPDGSDELSEFNSTGVKVTYYEPPTLTKVANGKTGVNIEWSAADYVGTYNVYRKTGNNVDWVLIGSKTGTTFTDTDVVSNAHYTYAIRSTVNGTVASAISNTKDTTYYAAPVMTSIRNNNGSITVSWNQEAGIDTYRVFRSTDGGNSWKNMGDVNTTVFTDASANIPGGRYHYAVRCVKDGVMVSAMNDAKVSKYIAPVTNVKVVNASSGGTHKAKVTWTGAQGAKAYDVYRWTNGSGWTKVATVTSNTLTDTTPSEGYYGYYVVSIAVENSRSANSTPAYGQIN